jgi:nicotinamide mononucleotide adenylyltransferase
MASQPEPYEHMSLEEKNKADLKIKQFEETIIDLAQQVNSDIVDKEYTADEAIIESDSGNVKLFYFIGRLNPPHNGHIAALNKLVQMANSQGSVPLIILGSGPGSDDETKRTMDNPINFETKERFIRNVLPGRYKIVKMSNAALDVSQYVEDGLKDVGNVKNITINHIAGGKDEDATKLSFALKSAKKKSFYISTRGINRCFCSFY